MEVPEILGADLVLGGQNPVRSVITFDEFETDLMAFDLFNSYREKFDADPSASQDFLKSINTEKIIKLSSESLTTYTLPIITALQIENDRTFGNIVFILENETLFTGMVQYDPAQEWGNDFIILNIEHNFQGGINFIDNEGNSIASGDMMDGVFYQNQTMSTGGDDYCETTVMPEFVPCYGGPNVCPCENGEGTWTTYEIEICDYLNGGGGSGGNYEVPWPPPAYGSGSSGSGSTTRTIQFTFTEPVVPPFHINIMFKNEFENLLGEPLTQEQWEWIRATQENYEFAQFVAAEILTETFYEHTLDELIEALEEWQDYRSKMSESELAIFDSLSWGQQYKYLLSAYNATNRAKALYPNTTNEPCNQWNGIGDAYRHALWNALSTVRIGETLTEQLTTAHEIKPSLYQHNYKEDEMDLFNNQVGRQLVNNAGLLWEIVKNSLDNGELRYLKPLGDPFNQCRANASSVLTPTNQ